MVNRVALAAVAAVALLGCPPPAPPASSSRAARHVISDDILARPPATSYAVVQFVLISWDELLRSNPRRPPDPRAVGRTRAQAETLALDVLDRARHGDDFVQLMGKYSEDPGSARTGFPIPIRPNGALEPDFQALGLRLKVGEVGVCETAYGFHVVRRLE
jgi:hypothetical protein